MTTPNIGLIKPTVGADSDAWGGDWNTNADTVDALFASGTFTPAITFATPGTLSVSYAAQNGTYVQAGKLVYVTLALTFTPTLGTASGEFRITGLPVTAAGTTFAGGAINFASSGFSWPASRTMLTPSLTTTTALAIAASGSAVATSNLAATDLTSGAQHIIDVTLLYRAA